MKIIKNFTLDSELAQLLEGENNASGLVNELLQQYYQEKTENLDKELQEMRRKSKEIRKKMHILREKRAKEAEKQQKILKESTQYRKVTPISEEEARRIKRTGKWE